MYCCGRAHSQTYYQFGQHPVLDLRKKQHQGDKSSDVNHSLEMRFKIIFELLRVAHINYRVAPWRETDATLHGHNLYHLLLQPPHSTLMANWQKSHEMTTRQLRHSRLWFDIKNTYTANPQLVGIEKFYLAAAEMQHSGTIFVKYSVYGSTCHHFMFLALIRDVQMLIGGIIRTTPSS